MKILMVITLSLILTACGGGGGGSSPVATAGNDGSVDEPTTTQSFKETTLSLMKADENSEPMDINAVMMDMDIEDDDTAFESVMTSTVGQ